MDIIIAGDYCPQQRVAKSFNLGNYEAVFAEVKPIIEQSDYAVVNFECPVCTDNRGLIKKVGPSLKCDAIAVDALKYVGFKCATLANNHFYDQGEEGVIETIGALKKVGIDYVGGGINLSEASRILYKNIKGQTLAIINCCEHEFSIATETTGGSNPLNSIAQFNAIQEAKNKARYVLVIVHGGIEHFQYPSPRMVEIYRFFIDAGADAVVNHHQHCFSGYESYKGKPIVYGLGNFCFDWGERDTKLWREGMFVKLTFDEHKVECLFYPYEQNGKEIGIHLMRGEDYTEWKSRFEAISKTITDEKSLKARYQELLNKTCHNYSTCLTPYVSRFALGLYRRHLLPMLFSRSKRRILLDMVLCESHYDRFIHMLSNYSK